MSTQIFFFVTEPSVEAPDTKNMIAMVSRIEEGEGDEIKVRQRISQFFTVWEHVTEKAKTFECVLCKAALPFHSRLFTADNLINKS